MAREMVTVSIYLSYFLTLIYVSNAKVLSELVPVVKSISIVNESSNINGYGEVFSKVIVEMRGDNFYSGMKVRATTNLPDYGECSKSDSDSEHNFSELWVNSTCSLMALSVKLKPDFYNKNFYICVESLARTTTGGNQSTIVSTFPHEVISWVHQGKNVVFRTASEYELQSLSKDLPSSDHVHQNGVDVLMKLETLFIWGAVKASVYKNCPKSMNELNIAIVTYTGSVTACFCEHAKNELNYEFNNREGTFNI